MTIVTICIGYLSFLMGAIGYNAMSLFHIIENWVVFYDCTSYHIWPQYLFDFVEIDSTNDVEKVEILHKNF